jgi:S-(hydroxymethyl)glutathione dehydrogenase / alcohol dehydrogenase
MRGIIWDGNSLRLEEIDVRNPGVEEVRVRVLASGICHSDLRPIDFRYDRVPIVLGHEASGVIDMVGPGVVEHRLGDLVAVGTMTPCYHCRECERGNLSGCPAAWSSPKTPFTWRNEPVYSWANSSSFAQQIVVRADQLYNAYGIPAEQAALLGCAVSTGVGAARVLGGIKPGDSVVVIGIGGIGVNALQGARLAGASTLVAVDTDSHKLPVASRYGATHSVHVERSSTTARTAQLIATATPQVDVVIECSGAPSALELATALPGIGGRAVLIGIPPPDTHIQFSASNFVWGRTYISGVNGGIAPGAEFQRLVQEVRDGLIDVASQITRVWPLEDFAEAIASLRAGDVTRAVLDMH